MKLSLAASVNTWDSYFTAKCRIMWVPGLLIVPIPGELGGLILFRTLYPCLLSDALTDGISGISRMEISQASCHFVPYLRPLLSLYHSVSVLYPDSVPSCLILARVRISGLVRKETQGPFPSCS